MDRSSSDEMWVRESTSDCLKNVFIWESCTEANYNPEEQMALEETSSFSMNAYPFSKRTGTAQRLWIPGTGLCESAGGNYREVQVCCLIFFSVYVFT